MPGDDAFAGERGQLVEALAAARRGEKEALERAQHDRQQLDALRRSRQEIGEAPAAPPAAPPPASDAGALAALGAELRKQG